MEDTRQVALVDSLEGQGGDQGGADTATIFGGKDLDGVLGPLVRLLGPVENLPQSLGASLLEEGVLVEDRSIRTDMACLVVLLLADSSNTASRETSSSCADKLGGLADKLQLRACTSQVELG